MSHSEKPTTDSAESPAATWSAGIHPELAAVLQRHQVAVQQVDPWTVRFEAVPVAASSFSKERTNLLLQRTAVLSSVVGYVDADLQYHGSDQAVAKALSGLCRRNWRRLRLPLLPGTVSEALYAVLQLLGSPLAILVRRAVRLPPAESAVATDSSQLLRAVGHAITPEMAAATYAESVRQGLARQLAVVPTRPVMPRSVVLWGRPGSGIDHLMVAAVHPLFEAEIVSQVFRVSAARLAAGRVFAQEVDAALMTLFDDVAECDGCLLLVQDLHACVTNSVVSHQLLCRALDAGLRMFASVSSDTVLARLRDDEATARRLAAVQVPAPDAAQTVAVLERLAAASQLKVDRPAIETAVRIADRQQAAQPAAAVALLGAAMAEAAWAGRAQLGPEDIVAVLQSQWPDDP